MEKSGNWIDEENIPRLLDGEVSKIKSKEDLFKLVNEIKDERIPSFDRFKKYLCYEWLGARHGEGALAKDLKRQLKKLRSGNMPKNVNVLDVFGGSILGGCLQLFKFGKIFNIEERIGNLLGNTKNKIYLRKLPFNCSIFIPCNISMDNESINIFAIIIFPYKDREDTIGAYSFGHDKKDGEFFYQCLNVPSVDDPWDESKNDSLFSSKKEERNGKKRIREYICSFLDFINHPEVETKVIKWFNNEKRVKRGQLPIPDNVNIKINGKLYRYIYENEKLNMGRSADYKFWVRGHYIHFWNKKRYNKLYKMNQEQLKELGYYTDGNGTVSKWVLPYIKGDGELKNKIYNLKEEEKCAKEVVTE